MSTVNRSVEGSVYFVAAMILPPLFYLSQRHPRELDIWFAGAVGATLLYCAALCVAKSWLRAILIVIGILAAAALAAFAALLLAASAAGIGPHWGWI